MKAGNLNKQITIEEYVETVDDFGGSVKTWVQFSTVRAKVKQLNGTEKYVSNEKYASATHEIMIRYIDGLNTKMRLIYNRKIFDINSVININEANREMQLITEDTNEYTLLAPQCAELIDCTAVIECAAIFGSA